MFKGVHSKITEIIHSVGESSFMPCNFTQPQWYKNGTKLNDTSKVKSTLSLYIFCLELSDNGIYECRDKKNIKTTKKYNLIVNNPGSYLVIFYV